MAFGRHMEIHGTTTHQLAEDLVSVRYQACLTPDAVMRNPIAIEDHESARFITAPPRLLDYCLINDGAVCLIPTSKERYGDFRKPPVFDFRFWSTDKATIHSITGKSTRFYGGGHLIFNQVA
jgi:acetyl-CoA acetyltransferase